MDMTISKELQAFREEVRRFIGEHLPADIRREVQQEKMDLPREYEARWHRILYERGWSCPSWPKEYGGTGWSYEQQYIFERELALNDAPRPLHFGTTMLGPAIIEFGTEEQKQRFLPGILSGDEFWCQGYSEPNAGSDLASLQCRAERDGAEYVINGTKIWTTDGHKADFMFGLFRTDSSGKKQHGITFLLLDLGSTGISMTPIVTFDGGREINQVFFDDVRVPVANRLGEEHCGWTIAKYVLGLERFGTAEVSRSMASLARLKAIAAMSPCEGSSLMENRAFADRLAELEIDLQALEVTEQRFLFGTAGPDAMGPEASMLKVRGTEVQQKITELTVEALGYYAHAHVPEQLQDGYNAEHVGLRETGYAAAHYFNMRKISIYSGSNEIQKNIIAKAVLGL